MNHSRAKLREVIGSDPEFASLIRELHKVTHVDPVGYMELSVFDYLQQCVFPNGGSMKPVRLAKRLIEELDPFGQSILLQQIGSVGNVTHRILADLLSGKHGVEDKPKARVFSLLNDAFTGKPRRLGDRYLLRKVMFEF